VYVMASNISHNKAIDFFDAVANLFLVAFQPNNSKKLLKADMQ